VATEFVIRFRARPEDLERADQLAQERGVNRSELLRGLLAVASRRPESRERLTQDDLVGLLEARARGGHLPAIEALLKREDARTAEQARARDREARRRAWAASAGRTQRRRPMGRQDNAQRPFPGP